MTDVLEGCRLKAEIKDFSSVRTLRRIYFLPEAKLEFFFMRNIKNIPVKRAFTLSFCLLVVLPLFILVFLFVFLSYSNYFERAMENIELVQETMEETIIEEVNEVRMTLSHIAYANDGSILDYIKNADTADQNRRYSALSRLEDVLDYTLQFDSSVLSMIFTFDSMRSAVYKTDLNINSNPRIRHDTSLIDEDIVSVSAFSSGSTDRFYSGSNPNDMIFSALLLPGSGIDREGRIESIEFFTISDIYRQINKYDTGYSLGNNSIGYTAVIDKGSGSILSSSKIDPALALDFMDGKEHPGYIYVSREVRISEIDCVILTVVRVSDISGGFLLPGLMLFLLVVFIVVFVVLFSRLLMKNVIRPVKNISDGLKSVEDGNLDMHLDSEGYEEINATIKSFNGMVRHQRALIDDYKSKLKASERQADRLFASFVSGNLKDEDAGAAEEKLFSSQFCLLLISCQNSEVISTPLLYRHLDSNLHFASQCYIAQAEAANTYFVYYREERGASRSVKELVSDIQAVFQTVFDTKCIIVTSRKLSFCREAESTLEAMHTMIPFISLMSGSHLLDLDDEMDSLSGALSHMTEYRDQASALYIADERVEGEAKEALNNMISHSPLQEAKERVCALFADFSIRLQKDGLYPYAFFGYNPGIWEKIVSAEDNTSLAVYVNNLLSEIMDISARNLDLDNSDMIAKAKRYIADNFQHSDLTLSAVSEYVGLNERYFSTCFSKQCGETFSSYLSALRIQNAKNLLRTTSFKVYEIASMSGYSTSENFNKAFKKAVGMTPNEYKKNCKCDENRGKDSI